MKTIILPLMALTFLASCKKDKNIPDKLSEFRKLKSLIVNVGDAGVYGGIFDETDGTFIIQSRATGYSEESELARSCDITGNIKGSSGNLDLGDLVVGDLTIESDETLGNYYHLPSSSSIETNYALMAAMFGSTVTLRLDDDASIFENTLYFPLGIKFDMNLGTDYEPLSLDAGADPTINWNMDDDNPNGVAIMCQYRTGSSSEPIVSNVIFVEDNGEASLPASFFEDIPDNGSDITITLYRGDVKIITGADNRTYKLIAFTACSHHFTVD